MRWTLSFHWTDLYLAFTQALCFACCNHIKNSKSTFHQYILKESKPAVPKLIPTKNKVKRSVASWAKGTDVGLVRDRRCSWVRPLLSSCNPLLPLQSCKLLNLFFPEKVSLVLPSRVVNVEHFGASAVHPPCNRSLVFLLLKKLYNWECLAAHHFESTIDPIYFIGSQPKLWKVVKSINFPQYLRVFIARYLLPPSSSWQV